MFWNLELHTHGRSMHPTCFLTTFLYERLRYAHGNRGGSTTGTRVHIIWKIVRNLWL